MKVSTITKVSEEPEVPEVPAAGEEPIVSKGKVEKRGGNRFGYNYIFIKSYKESQKNDVVKCLYIKSLTNFGFCVIKEGTYGDSKDKDGRDIIDRLKWQKQLHEQLQDKVRMPKFLECFEEKGNYYLVIEHIKGKPFYKICDENRKELRQGLIAGNKISKRFLGYLIQMVNILETIHKEGIVHRDATPNNYMIMPNGKVALIDMEMCYSTISKFPTPAFALGTFGYMSKQQEAINIPTTAEDIFAFGAILLQMWSNVSPLKITNEPITELTKKIFFFIPDQQIANLVIQCLQPEDNLRPNATQVLQVLKQYEQDLNNKIPRISNQPILYTREEIIDTLQEAIHTMATPLLADTEKGWFSDDLKPASAEDKHKLRKQWYASFSRGASGVIYVLARAQSLGLDIGLNKTFVENALNLLKLKYIDRAEQASTGLYFGSDGIAAMLSIAIPQGLIPSSSEYLEWVDILLQKSSQSKDMENGVAGQGIANLLSKSFVQPQKLQERLLHYAELLINKQHKEGYWLNGYYREKYTKRKMKRVTRGITEGMSGILYFLLQYGYHYNHQQSKDAARLGLKWLIKKARHKKKEIQFLSARGNELGFGWAEGIAGIAFVFIQAFRFTSMPIYRQYAEKTLYSIPADIIDGNISQDSGLSGIGEVYLEAYQVFSNREWFDRAGWIAQVIMQQKKIHSSHGTYWLVKGERSPVANFMVGNSGVIHFLLRYCHPNKISFPLMTEE